MAPPAFLNLNNGFYNAFSQGLGFPPGSPFQIAQPSPPLVAGPNQNQQLWNYFNLIPPLSLTNNYVLSPGNQFFSNYSGLLSALQGAPNNFVRDVGEACNAAWNAYVNTLPVTVTLSQFPAIFQRWAATHGYITVANKGAADLAQMILDPVTAAQLAIMPYSGSPPTNLPNWDVGYTDLVSNLANAPNRAFSFNSSTGSSNVSNTWCSGSQSAFFGLWSNSSSSSSQSETFASATVTVAATFQHLTQFTAVPGAWYSSSATGDAYRHQSGPPWVGGQPITWQTTFSQSGNLARFAANIVVASGMSTIVESAASYTHNDQSLITQNSSAGMWPFYSQDSDSGTQTKATFNNSGNMTVVITSKPGVPIVLGVNVLSAGEFLGAAVEGAKMYDAALKQQAA